VLIKQRSRSDQLHLVSIRKAIIKCRKYLAACGDDNQIYLWNTLNPKRKLELHGHEKKCSDVIFSPN
jgi:WD40 repeat protein